MPFVPVEINSTLFCYERLIDNNNSLELGAKILYLFAVNKSLAEYYKSWGFCPVDDNSFNERLTSDWQNDYSKGCIFMYKPIAEML